MESNLRHKIEGNIENYFPGKNFSLKSVTQVTTKPKSYVYNALIVNSIGERKEIYIKKIGENKKKGLEEILTFEIDWDKFLTPRILDYFEDDNVVLFEGVTGNSLSKNLLLYSFRLGGKVREIRLVECAKKIGNAIGFLHRSTEKNSAKIGEMNIYLVEQFETTEYFRKILGNQSWSNIQTRVESLKNETTKLVQFHGDLSPHNILLNKEDVYLLDFSYLYNAIFLDPVLFTVSLELMRGRFPLLLDSIISKMKKEFINSYQMASNEKWDKDTWMTFELLAFLHILSKYETRRKNIKNNIVAMADKRYIMNKINSFSKSL